MRKIGVSTNEKTNGMSNSIVFQKSKRITQECFNEMMQIFSSLIKVISLISNLNINV
jgi:hypothetical protein